MDRQSTHHTAPSKWDGKKFDVIPSLCGSVIEVVAGENNANMKFYEPCDTIDKAHHHRSGKITISFEWSGWICFGTYVHLITRQLVELFDVIRQWLWDFHLLCICCVWCLFFSEFPQYFFLYYFSSTFFFSNTETYFTLLRRVIQFFGLIIIWWFFLLRQRVANNGFLWFSLLSCLTFHPTLCSSSFTSSPQTILHLTRDKRKIIEKKPNFCEKLCFLPRPTTSTLLACAFNRMKSIVNWLSIM